VLFALSARKALLVWLGTCAALGLLFGWPVMAGSFALSIGPAYLSIRSRNFLVAFPFAFAGALAGALFFTAHSVIASAFLSLLTGIVVGHGLSMAAMWLAHRRTCAVCRSA